MISMKKIIILIAICSLFLPLYGCGKGKNEAGEKKLVARINNYEMTVEDFKDGAGLIGPAGSSDDPEKTKEIILDEMITKQLLLQEAQKQNFDKDKAFMKEIQRYWEQALLKLLYKKKVKELSGAVKVDDREVMDEYKRLLDAGDTDIAKKPFEEAASALRDDIRNRKLQQAMNAWIEGMRSGARIIKYKENLKDARIR